MRSNSTMQLLSRLLPGEGAGMQKDVRVVAGVRAGRKSIQSDCERGAFVLRGSTLCICGVY
eukprot:529584-Pelagomonas_calceolata.AAC.1